MTEVINSGAEWLKSAMEKKYPENLEDITKRSWYLIQMILDSKTILLTTESSQPIFLFFHIDT